MTMKYTMLLLFLGMITSAFSQGVRQKVDSIAKRYDAIGVAYVVVKDGQIFHSDAVGYKDWDQKIALSASTDLFRIASISKSFTATALMQLVEANKLSLDADFGDMIGFRVRNPYFPDKVITLRMLLSHTSSISDKNGYFNLDAINPNKNPEWERGYNNYEPGSQYEYCNLNFNMAGAALERAVGVRFDIYIKQKILAPLGLKGGYCVDSLDKGAFAKIYEYDGVKRQFEAQPAAYAPRSEEIRNYKLGYTTPVFSPTGGMKISTEDLARYMIMHMNYGESAGVRILQQSSARTMQTPVNKWAGYGLALRENKNLISGKTMVGHTGSAYGLYSTMFFQPEERFGIVAITNGCKQTFEDDKPELLEEVVDCLYKHFILFAK
ncbi:serine hydrolase domain-containing protein [Sphingobacterium faecale]|uniref:Beta-lactamase family protein n=1 Tax=Sphingobacterium faecale TaxID=2803775 RepID=A0ABS1QZ24_9SPHI|nr:serine hydrolase domain-containing protein [Sphingobacterium faecale]MBL1407686.1 beta-lactamase family protein [Sphingobacterium faecale]